MLHTSRNVEDLEEKVSCEIRESPSMMWKGTIVQAKAGCARAVAALALGLVVFVVSIYLMIVMTWACEHVQLNIIWTKNCFIELLFKKF